VTTSFFKNYNGEFVGEWRINEKILRNYPTIKNPLTYREKQQFLMKKTKKGEKFSSLYDEVEDNSWW